jgi:hypothetical protein
MTGPRPRDCGGSAEARARRGQAMAGPGTRVHLSRYPGPSHFKVCSVRKWSFGSRERLWGNAWEFRESEGTSPHQFDAGDTLVWPVQAGCARNIRESAKSRAWMLGAR